MADIWKIGQETNADKFYENTQKKCYMPIFDEEFQNVRAANILTQVCNQMAKTYDKVIEDQNEYLIDMDETADEISDIKSELEAKIKKLEEEIDALMKKKEDGTITEGEEAELTSKTGELESLKAQLAEQIDDKKGKIEDDAEKSKDNERKSKAQIATDYGETALEKGEPLAKTEDKRRSFWRRLTGSWNKQWVRNAGEKLIESGNNLLDKVHSSEDIDEEIDNKAKRSV